MLSFTIDDDPAYRAEAPHGDVTIAHRTGIDPGADAKHFSEMRILLVCHPPLTREFGAAQLAMNLEDALRARGHDAVAWSPAPVSETTRWWNYWRRQRRAIERFAAETGPFDVIDTPAISASKRLASCAERLVVRSIQPELLYLASNVRAEWTQRKIPSLAALLRIALSGGSAASIVAGWRRADVILCLGSQELQWMRRRFAVWSGKLGFYVCSPSEAERGDLVEVRRTRSPRSPILGTRFLWIGRWAAHKGLETLRRFILERAATHPLDTFTLAGCGSNLESDVPVKLLRTGTIRVVPQFHRSELPALLAEHDAGLFTSAVEGWGISLNEMLESGLPVFATQAGGVVDLRPYFPGLLQPFPPPESVYQEDRATAPGREYFERFSWPAIAADYEAAVTAGG